MNPGEPSQQIRVHSLDPGGRHGQPGHRVQAGPEVGGERELRRGQPLLRPHDRLHARLPPHCRSAPASMIKSHVEEKIHPIQSFRDLTLMSPWPLHPATPPSSQPATKTRYSLWLLSHCMFHSLSLSIFLGVPQTCDLCRQVGIAKLLLARDDVEPNWVSDEGDSLVMTCCVRGYTEVSISQDFRRRY